MKRTTIILLALTILSIIGSLLLAQPIQEKDMTELQLVGTYPEGTEVTGQNVLLISVDKEDVVGEVQVYQTKYWKEQVDDGFANVQVTEDDLSLNFHADDHTGFIYLVETTPVTYLFAPQETFDNNEGIHSAKICYFIYY